MIPKYFTILSASLIAAAVLLAGPGLIPQALAQADERASHPVEPAGGGLTPEASVQRGRMGQMVTPIEILNFSSPTEERRFRALISEMRCTVCQNESLIESTAPLARDKRMLVLRFLQEGHNDNEIRQFMVDRYGNFVLYRPPLTGQTLLLWAGPFLLMLGGLLTAFIIINKRRQALQ
ncbi:MAG: cytochrome c-type biogenesis protein CcmH [Wenzhouxiangella sp.]|nr:MAG: cytochrome c-type biogenesis protein CcmH [Wenzhouxiangella sp.]